MKLPLDRIKCYAYLLKKLTEYYPQVGPLFANAVVYLPNWATLKLSAADQKL